MPTPPPLPTVLVTPGPQYASSINAALQYLYNFVATPIPVPSGINVLGNLDFNGFGISDLSGLGLNSIAPLGTTNLLHVETQGSFQELYWTDNFGTPIRLTYQGAVNAAAGNITNLVPPAAVIWTGAVPTGTFSFITSSTRSAALQSGPITLLDTATSVTKGVTLASPISLANPYTLTLPAALPGSDVALLAVNHTTGAMNYNIVDNSTLDGSSNVLKVKAGGITTTQINASAGILGSQLSATAGILGSQLSASANINGSQLSATAGITKRQQAAVGQQISAAVSPSTSTTGFTDLTGLTVTITTVGRPVMVMCIDDGVGGGSYFTTGGTGSSLASLRVVVSGTASATIGFISIGCQDLGDTLYFSPSIVSTIFTGAAGTYTFQVQASAGGPTSVDLSATNVRLLAYEL